jgi:hypothetical protein
MHEQTTAENLLRARQQMIELEETATDDSLLGMFKRAAVNAVDTHARLISGVNNLVIRPDDQQEDFCELFMFENQIFDSFLSSCQ